MNEKITQEIYSKLRAFAPKKYHSDLGPNTRLLHDLLITGDDALDFWREFDPEEQIDMRGFHVDEFFPSELSWDALLIKPYAQFGWQSKITQKYKPIAVRDLVELANGKSWKQIRGDRNADVSEAVAARIPQSGSGGKLRFDIRLLIRHPSLNTDEITERLGLTPSTVRQAGKSRITPARTSLPGTYSETRLGWSQRHENERAFFDRVVSLCDSLASYREFLLEIVATGGSIEMVLHLPGDTNLGSTLGWQQLRQIADLRINLGVEVFPDFC